LCTPSEVALTSGSTFVGQTAGYQYFSYRPSANFSKLVFVDLKETSTPTNQIELYLALDSCPTSSTNLFASPASFAYNGHNTMLFYANTSTQLLVFAVYSPNAGVNYELTLRYDQAAYNIPLADDTRLNNFYTTYLSLITTGKHFKKRIFIVLGPYKYLIKVTTSVSLYINGVDYTISKDTEFTYDSCTSIVFNLKFYLLVSFW
jgi:hypothetical protein